MKSGRFDYCAAAHLDESLAILAAEGDDARIMAGGQSLIAMLNIRLVKPAVIVDISRIPGLDGISLHDDAVEVGATATQQALLETEGLAATAPLLAKALPWVGHYQTRSKGMVCGSIAHADPSSELPLCLAVLDGEVRLRNRQRSRSMKAREFQTGMLSTACSADEMVESVCFPAMPKGAGCAFTESASRHGDFALIAVAVVATATSIRIGVGGMTDRPEVRDLPMLDGGALDDALNALAWELKGMDDQHATARYRRDLVRLLGRSTVEEAMRCRA